MRPWQPRSLTPGLLPQARSLSPGLLPLVGLAPGLRSQIRSLSLSWSRPWSAFSDPVSYPWTLTPWSGLSTPLYYPLVCSLKPHIFTFLVSQPWSQPLSLTLGLLASVSYPCSSSHGRPPPPGCLSLSPNRLLSLVHAPTSRAPFGGCLARPFRLLLATER